jgi:hypothetical protein
MKSCPWSIGSLASCQEAIIDAKTNAHGDRALSLLQHGALVQAQDLIER